MPVGQLWESNETRREQVFHSRARIGRASTAIRRSSRAAYLISYKRNRAAQHNTRRDREEQTRGRAKNRRARNSELFLRSGTGVARVSYCHHCTFY